jgi:hypothetical protein
MDGLIQACAADLAILQRQLEPLEFGNLHTGERPFCGVWADTTFKQMSHLRRMIADLEAIVGRLKAIALERESFKSDS